MYEPILHTPNDELYELFLLSCPKRLSRIDYTIGDRNVGPTFILPSADRDHIVSKLPEEAAELG